MVQWSSMCSHLPKRNIFRTACLSASVLQGPLGLRVKEPPLTCCLAHNGCTATFWWPNSSREYLVFFGNLGASIGRTQSPTTLLLEQLQQQQWGNKWWQGRTTRPYFGTTPWASGPARVAAETVSRRSRVVSLETEHTYLSEEAAGSWQKAVSALKRQHHWGWSHSFAVRYVGKRSGAGETDSMPYFVGVLGLWVKYLIIEFNLSSKIMAHFELVKTVVYCIIHPTC